MDDDLEDIVVFGCGMMAILVCGLAAVWLLS